MSVNHAKYNFKYTIFPENAVYNPQIKSAQYRHKLIPITSWGHMAMHNKYKKDNNWVGFRRDNDLAIARVKHLYEIIQRPYDQKKNYKNLLLAEFRSREDNVIGNRIRIWEDFRDNKIFEEWIKRYIEKKEIEKDTKNDDEWYKRYFSKFYGKRYIRVRKSMTKYLDKVENMENIKFWDWYFNDYLIRNWYPIIYE